LVFLIHIELRRTVNHTSDLQLNLLFTYKQIGSTFSKKTEHVETYTSEDTDSILMEVVVSVIYNILISELMPVNS